MAADQRKKRLNAASVVGHSSYEQHKVKRKKLVMSSIRSNITLEWDDKRKSVVPKREQIGIAQRDLSPFINSVPNCYSALGDIVTVPRETFELEDLTEVLSCEVWQNHLSEKERNFLAQFLPKGVDAQKVVQELLDGDNFHFGNSFLKWSTSLCSGSLHPDTVLDKERVFKANKKEYYSDLQKYHHDMIGNLQMLKGRWASCKDPEMEIGQKLWRSRNDAEKSRATHANESRHHDPANNLVGTSESYSSASDDKACSSDDLNFMLLHEDSQRRKGFVGGKYDTSSDALKVVAGPRKGEKLPKPNFQCGDGAKYMSYIKVSKEQHQRVKSSMKHSSNSMHCRSLNHVLGDLDTFCVQPYKVFEEEERKKLHEHWSKLANRDVAAGFANWRGRQIEKQQVIQALGKELVEKVNYLKENEEKENPNNIPTDQVDDRATDLESAILVEDEDKESSESLLQEQMYSAVTNNASSIKLEDGGNENHNSIFQQQSDNEAANDISVMEDETECPPTTSQNQHLQQTTSLGANHNSIFQQQSDNEAANDESVMEDETECPPTASQNQHLQQTMSLGGKQVFHAMDLDSHENCAIPKLDDFLPSVSKYAETLSHVGVPFSQENPLSVASNVWPAVSMPSVYYHSTPLNHEYASANELSLQHPQVMEEHPAQLMDLQPDIQKEDPEKDLLCRQSNDDFFSTYPNQVRNEHFHSFFKGQGSLPYYHEEKNTMLDFQPPASVMLENGQFVGHLWQLHPSTALDLRQKRSNDIYMHQNNQENMYGVGYTIPRQEHFSTLKMQDWAANAAHLSGPSQSHLNGGELSSQNWFSGENRIPGDWSGSEGAVCPSQSIGNGSIADQSLFSVLSQCDDLHPGAPYDSMGANESFNQSGIYNGVGRGLPATSNVLLRTVNPLNYFSGHEASDGLKTNNMGWVSLPRQSSALHDSMGKPYLR